MANSTLSRTQVTGNRTTFTFSAWVKRSKLGVYQMIYSSGASTTYRTQLAWHEDDIIQFYNNDNGVNMELKTNRRFRDVSAWYHIVLRFDTTQGTAADRIRLYVNGEQETSFSTATYPTQNADNTQFNYNGVTVKIGSASYASSNFFEGYMSHVAFADGASLGPTSFGLTDSTSGMWKFKPPSGVTYGNNGFHLKMENSGNLGLDSSGETHNFTTAGDLKQALDTPSNIYSTLNALYKDGGSAITYTNGNTTADVGSGNDWCTSPSTQGVSAGKWYFEAKLTLNSNNEAYIGVANQGNLQIKTNEPNYLGEDADTIGYYSGNGDIYYNANASSYGNSWTTGDIIGCALDIDNSKLYFSKNGTWQNSGVPTSGSTGTGAIALYHTAGDVWHLCVSPNQSKLDCNFGNGFFGTTAISSAGSNGNGSLFEYDVPSGYYALNTKNINTYG